MDRVEIVDIMVHESLLKPLKIHWKKEQQSKQLIIVYIMAHKSESESKQRLQVGPA